MPFHIVRNDITHMKVDAIVNSANPLPTYAYGTDLAIYIAAGADQLLTARQRIGEIFPGQVGITPAFHLNAKYILHTVGPSWEGGEHNEFEILRNCYDNSLKTARLLHCRSIAFPLIATGIYGFPKDRALQVAMSAIQGFLLRYSMDVFLVVFDESSFVMTGNIYDQIQEYVDANYVEDAHESEYGIDDKRSGNDKQNSNDQIVSDELRNQVVQDLKSRAERVRLCAETDDTHHLQGSNLAQMISASTGKEQIKQAIDSWKDVTEKTFQEKLFEYIDRSGLKPSAIYRPIEMSRQSYSKMQCNREYQPKKNTAMLLCIVLHLSLEEAEDLLSRAGLAFNPSSKQDMIVKACLACGQYDFFVIDGMLQMNHLDSLIDYEGKKMSPLN